MTAGQAIIAVTTDQAIAAIAAEQKIVAALAVQHVVAAGPGNDAAAVAADISGREHHRAGGIDDVFDGMSGEMVDDLKRAVRHGDNKVIADVLSAHDIREAPDANRSEE